jgi:hypothetical protein
MQIMLTPDGLCAIARGLSPIDRRRVMRLVRQLDIAGVKDGNGLDGLVSRDALVRNEIDFVRRLVTDEGDAGGHPPVYL